MWFAVDAIDGAIINNDSLKQFTFSSAYYVYIGTLNKLHISSTKNTLIYLFIWVDYYMVQLWCSDMWHPPLVIVTRVQLRCIDAFEQCQYLVISLVNMYLD